MVPCCIEQLRYFFERFLRRRSEHSAITVSALNRSYEFLRLGNPIDISALIIAHCGIHFL